MNYDIATIERLESELAAMTAERDDWKVYAVEAGAQKVRVEVQNRDLLAALKQYEQAFDGLFTHCLSNGIFNAWQAPHDCTALNLAHEAARAAIAIAASTNITATIKCATNCGADVPVMAKDEGEDHLCGRCGGAA
jgi:hypothetical protein